MIEEHLKLLGLKVEDKVTSYEGIVTSVSFDLYGCVQVIVTSQTILNTDKVENKWFDVTRLEILNSIPVMEQPDFTKGYIATGKKGSFEKPTK